MCGIFRVYGGSIRNRPGDCVVAVWRDSLSFPTDRALLAVHRARSASLRLGIATHTGLHIDRVQLLAESGFESRVSDLPSLFGRGSWLAARVQAQDTHGHILGTREFIDALTIPSRWSDDAQTLDQLGTTWNVRRLESVGLSAPATSRHARRAFHSLEAEAAEKAGAPSEVREHAEQALSAIESPWRPEAEDDVSRLTLLRIDALTALGRLDDAERSCHDLIARVETRSTHKGKACLYLAGIRRLQGHSAQELEALHRALDRLSTEALSADRGVGLLFLGQAFLRSGDTRRGSDVLRDCRHQLAMVTSSPLSSQLDRGTAELHLGMLNCDVYRERATGMSHLAAALREFTEAGHLRYQRNTLNTLGTIAMERFDYPSAESYFGRALTLARAVDDRSLAATVLKNFAALWYRRLDSRSGTDDSSALEIALSYYEEAKHIFTSLGYRRAADECALEAEGVLEQLERETPSGPRPSATHHPSPHPKRQRRRPPSGPDVPPAGIDPFLRARWWHERGRQYHDAERHETALKCFREAADCKLQVADQSGLGNTYHMIGIVHEEMGDTTNARSFMLKSLDIEAAEGDVSGVKVSLFDLALFLVRTGEACDGASLLAAYYGLRDWEQAQQPGEQVNRVLGALDLLEGTHRPAIEQAMQAFFQNARRAGA